MTLDWIASSRMYNVHTYIGKIFIMGGPNLDRITFWGRGKIPRPPHLHYPLSQFCITPTKKSFGTFLVVRRAVSQIECVPRTPHIRYANDK